MDFSNLSHASPNIFNNHGDVNIFMHSKARIISRNHAGGNAKVHYGDHIQGIPSTPTTAIKIDPMQEEAQPPDERKKRTKCDDDPRVTISNRQLKYRQYDRDWYSQYRVIRVSDDEPDEKLRGRTLVVLDCRETKQSDGVLCIAFHRHFEIKGGEDDPFFKTNARAYTDGGDMNFEAPEYVEGDSLMQQEAIVVHVEKKTLKFLKNTWLDARHRYLLPYSSWVADIGVLRQSDFSHRGADNLDEVADCYYTREY